MIHKSIKTIDQVIKGLENKVNTCFKTHNSYGLIEKEVTDYILDEFQTYRISRNCDLFNFKQLESEELNQYIKEAIHAIFDLIMSLSNDYKILTERTKKILRSQSIEYSENFLKVSSFSDLITDLDMEKYENIFSVCTNPDLVDDYLMDIEQYLSKLSGASKVTEINIDDTILALYVLLKIDLAVNNVSAKSTNIYPEALDANPVSDMDLLNINIYDDLLNRILDNVITKNDCISSSPKYEELVQMAKSDIIQNLNLIDGKKKRKQKKYANNKDLDHTPIICEAIADILAINKTDNDFKRLEKHLNHFGVMQGLIDRSKFYSSESITLRNAIKQSSKKNKELTNSINQVYSVLLQLDSLVLDDKTLRVFLPIVLYYASILEKLAISKKIYIDAFSYLDFSKNFKNSHKIYKLDKYSTAKLNKLELYVLTDFHDFIKLLNCLSSTIQQWI